MACVRSANPGGLRSSALGLLMLLAATGGPSMLPAQPPVTKSAGDAYAVPDGTAEEIRAFLDRLQNERPRFTTRKEAIEHPIKVQRAIAAGAEKILATKSLDNAAAAEAAEMLLDAHLVLAGVRLDGALEQARQAAQRLKDDPRPEVASLARDRLVQIRILQSPSLDEEGRRQLARETLAPLEQPRPSAVALRNALQLGNVLSDEGEAAAAAEYYNELADRLEKSEQPEHRTTAKQVRGLARQRQLPGRPMEVVGATHDGKPFDVKDWKGKVVLVDFWASWSRPSIAELPQLKRYYEAYHPRGFEVVGISLDETKKEAAAFLKERQIPWTNLYADEEGSRGWDNPVAVRYGITSIPTGVLIDREGNVVSLKARGVDLGKLLERHLGPVEPTP